MICQEAAAGAAKTLLLQSPHKDQPVGVVLLGIYTASTPGKPCVHPPPSDDQRA